MQLRHRVLKGITRPFQEVDKTLYEQGFERPGNDSCEYQLIINDPVTRSSYALLIPFTIINPGDHELAKLGSPYLMKRYYYHPLDRREHIPSSIRKAAEEKAVEVFTYLASLKGE